jgi:hypothetical protein
VVTASTWQPLGTEQRPGQLTLAARELASCQRFPAFLL